MHMSAIKNANVYKTNASITIQTTLTKTLLPNQVPTHM